ncbi:MAG: hypothetical protein ACRC9L_07375 [Brevinema sp.]
MKKWMIFSLWLSIVACSTSPSDDTTPTAQQSFLERTVNEAIQQSATGNTERLTRYVLSNQNSINVPGIDGTLLNFEGRYIDSTTNPRRHRIVRAVIINGLVDNVERENFIDSLRIVDYTTRVIDLSTKTFSFLGRETPQSVLDRGIFVELTPTLARARFSDPDTRVLSDWENIITTISTVTNFMVVSDNSLSMISLEPDSSDDTKIVFLSDPADSTVVFRR